MPFHLFGSGRFYPYTSVLLLYLYDYPGVRELILWGIFAAIERSHYRTSFRQIIQENMKNDIVLSLTIEP